jgi:hypothetical protein
MVLAVQRAEALKVGEYIVGRLCLERPIACGRIGPTNIRQDRLGRANRLFYQSFVQHPGIEMHMRGPLLAGEPHPVMKLPFGVLHLEGLSTLTPVMHTGDSTVYDDAPRDLRREELAEGL